MSRTRNRRRTAVRLLLLISLLAGSGCQISNLQFRNDNRLEFSAPKERALVKAPVTVSWRMSDFVTSGLDGSSNEGNGAFAVFVDKAPMPVGKDLKWLARKDVGCKRDARCPDAAYLKDRGIYLTTSTSITIETLPSVGDGVGDEQHYVNVVLVDGTGHRIGESAWYRPFSSKRRESP
ncbi:MAG: hypothetical protein JWM40_1369 [Frankiales bacterium]|nr:hypothetical protein [Frankiales bacterium]